MTNSNGFGEDLNVNGDPLPGTMKQRFKVRSEKVAKTKEMLSKQAVQTKKMLSKQAVKIAKRAEEHERFINKVTHLLGVLGFGGFCFLLGARIVFFTIRWWNPITFEAMQPEGTSSRISWPYVEDQSFLWTWLFGVPLAAYTLWQVLYFLIVHVLRRQRLLRDPEVMTSYRELSKKAKKANNIWWRLNGMLGDQNRFLTFVLFQAIFTVATMALTVPIFLSYKCHVIFQILKVSASVWNGGSFLLEVMPRQVIVKEKTKYEIQMQPVLQDQPSELTVNTMTANSLSEIHRT